MIESKLTNILSTFSKEEIKSFEKFISSPYFSIGRDVSGLFKALKKLYPNLKSSGAEKKKIFEAVFPKEAYNEKKLKNISFELTRLAEQFLVHENIRLNENLSMKILIQEFKNRKQDKYFLTAINVFEKK